MISGTLKTGLGKRQRRKNGAKAGGQNVIVFLKLRQVISNGLMQAFSLEHWPETRFPVCSQPSPRVKRWISKAQINSKSPLAPRKCPIGVLSLPISREQCVGAALLSLPRHSHLELRYGDSRTPLLEGLTLPILLQLFTILMKRGRRGLSSAPANCVVVAAWGPSVAPGVRGPF